MPKIAMSLLGNKPRKSATASRTAQPAGQLDKPLRRRAVLARHAKLPLMFAQLAVLQREFLAALRVSLILYNGVVNWT